MSRGLVLAFALMVGAMLWSNLSWSPGHATGVPVTTESVVVDVVGNPPP